MCKPLAVELYEAYQQGASIEELSRQTGIAAARVEQRVRAAAEFLKDPSHALRYLEHATRTS